MKKSKPTHISKKSLRRHIFLSFIAIIVIIIAIVCGCISGAYSEVHKKIDKKIDKNDIASEEKNKISGYKTIALFGIDNRSNGEYSIGNSDTIIIANINNDTKEVKLVSVYRDTFLKVTKTRYQKCNYAYNAGGPENALSMLNSNLDLTIDDYVSVDWNALVTAIDAVGGLDIDINSVEAKDINKNCIDEINSVTHNHSSYVKPGHNHFDGVQATGYCRIRHTRGNDFRRTARQREVIAKLTDKIQNLSLPAATSLLQKLFPMVSTSLDLPQILDLFRQIHDYTIADTTGFPFDMRADHMNTKGDVIVPCDLVSNVTKLHEFLYDSKDYKPSEKVCDINKKIYDITSISKKDAVKYDLQ